jgi:hypothetical protein
MECKYVPPRRPVRPLPFIQYVPLAAADLLRQDGSVAGLWKSLTLTSNPLDVEAG